MQLDFQKKIASSQFTLPIVCTIGLVLWLLMPISYHGETTSPTYSLWAFMPTYLTQGTIGMSLAIGFVALAVYLMAELNNAFVLLRISSRLLSSTLAILFIIPSCMHSFFPGHIVLVMVLLSFFSLFATYQRPVPLLAFMTFLPLSVSSLVFTKMLYFVPIYWAYMIYMRSLSFRCFMASVFALLLPYWILFGAVMGGDSYTLPHIEVGWLANSYQAEGFGLQFFVDTCKSIIEVQKLDYSSLDIKDILVLAFCVLLFAIGAVNFFMTSYLDKTRTRIIYTIVIVNNIVVLTFMSLQPQFFHALLPILLIGTSIVGGHYLALTSNKLSHIFCIVLAIMFTALLVAQIML